MQKVVADMLERYENGQVSRRDLVRCLAAVAAGAASAQAADATFEGLEINHVALQVTDVRRSRDFYQKHLGLPVVRESESNCFLGMGKNFLALFQGSPAGLNHYCIAVRDYEVGKIAAELERQGLDPRQPRGSDRVYFDDPDGIEVQLSAVGHQP